MASRIQIYVKLNRPYSDPNTSHWQPSEHDVKLVEWLKEHLGPPNRDTYKLPLRGPGWLIAAAHEYDANLEDYSWRRVMGTTYQPKGKYGIWIEIDNDEVAVLLRLSGLLDERPRGPKMFPESLDYDETYWNKLTDLLKV